MKIRVKLTLLFTLLTATILLFFALVVYYTAKENREKKFFELLKKEAITKAHVFLKSKIDANTLHYIYHINKKTINEVEVAIYNNQKQLLYDDEPEIGFANETDKLLDQIKQEKEIFFYQNEHQVIGINYTIDNKNYIITAIAFDHYGYNKLDLLLKNIVLIYILSLLFIIFSAFFFTNKAIDPIKEIINKTKQISASQLNVRIETKSKGDELAELSMTINEMLQRLESSFDAQKNFVSNIAHELRTPLATIVAELEIALNKTRTNEEYQQLIQYVLNDTNRIVRFSNSLLDMAKANYDRSQINFKATRIDEVILDATAQVLKSNDLYQVDPNFIHIPSEEKDIIINANEYLLKVACINLIENACKYSSNYTCKIDIDFNQNEVIINFINIGEKIDLEEIKSIFDPFYRCKQHQLIQGEGIGLSLTKKIIDLHKGIIEVTSDRETYFIIKLFK